MFHVKRFGTIGGQKSHRALYIARFEIGGIARTNRPMSHRDRDRELGGNPGILPHLTVCLNAAYRFPADAFAG